MPNRLILLKNDLHSSISLGAIVKRNGHIHADQQEIARTPYKAKLAAANRRIFKHTKHLGWLNPWSSIKNAAATIHASEKHSHTYDQAVREDERKRIARELHDELGQLLSCIRLKVNGCQMMSQTSNDISLIEEQLNSMNKLINEAQAATKDIVFELRTDSMQCSNFKAALQERVNRFQLETNITCLLNIYRFEGIQLAESQASSLLRILQESLTNIIKHANADKVLISMYPHGKYIILKVIDNGAGFNMKASEKAPHSKSFGLIGIEERVSSLGGVVKLKNRPCGGAQVMVKIPL